MLQKYIIYQKNIGSTSDFYIYTGNIAREECLYINSGELKSPVKLLYISFGWITSLTHLCEKTTIMKKIFTFSLVLMTVFLQAQTVTDYDGNVYNVIQIGDQFWLQQNLKSLHYSDGTLIPDVRAYENSDSLAVIYGRLYTWDATMRNTTIPMAQGVCPDGWHIPSSQEWGLMEDFLGGANVAGGAMKVTGYDHWDPPNSGATNSSGFTVLAAGEFDTPNGIFQFLKQYAVFWTSTEVSTTKARERFLSYNSASCDIYDWHKSLNYSIRCVKDENTGMDSRERQDLHLFPNPASTLMWLIITTIPDPGEASVYDLMGRVVLKEKISDVTNHTLDVGKLPAGSYMIQIRTGRSLFQKNFLKR